MHEKILHFYLSFQFVILEQENKKIRVAIFKTHIVFKLRICRKSDRINNFIWEKELYA